MKTYIKPEIEIYNVEAELLLIAESGGQLDKEEDEVEEDDESVIYDIWK